METIIITRIIVILITLTMVVEETITEENMELLVVIIGIINIQLRGQARTPAASVKNQAINTLNAGC